MGDKHYPINRTSVMDYLSQCVGKQNGIKCKMLAKILAPEKSSSIAERRIRSVVAALRNDGYPVCGFPSEGYYIAANDEELIDTCMFLYGRSMHSLNLIAKMRGVAELDLKGQLRLPT